MRLTPHLVVSALAVLLALALVLPRMGGAGLPAKTFNEEPKVVLEDFIRPVIPVEAVLNPLVAEPVDITEANDPFLPPLQSAGRISSHLPPPPLFNLPEPLPLPLLEK